MNNPPVRPWWEQQPSLCAESSPPGCSYNFFTQVECETEIEEDGVPVRRCINIARKLLKCPGREPVAGEPREELTYPASQAASRAERLALPETRPAQSTDVGEALEQVIRLAEDIQEGFMPSPGGVRLDTPGTPLPSPAAAAAVPSRVARGHAAPPERGLLSRLFGRQETVAGGGENAAWRDYAKDFQDV